jgi:hypothetical protein
MVLKLHLGKIFGLFGLLLLKVADILIGQSIEGVNVKYTYSTF